MHYLISDFWYEQIKTYGRLGPTVQKCGCVAGAIATTGAGTALMPNLAPELSLSASTLKPDGFRYHFFEYRIRAACDVDTYNLKLFLLKVKYSCSLAPH